MHNDKLTIIYFGDGWDEFWRRRQQIAYQLAKKESVGQVIYVEVRPLTLTSLLKYALSRADEGATRRWKRILEHGLTTKVGKVYIIPILVLLPTIRLGRLARLQSKFALHALFLRINKTIQNKNTRRILWISYPYPNSLLGAFGEDMVCYDSVDYHWRVNQFFLTNKLQDLEKWDLELIKRADLNFTNSPFLYKRVKSLSPNTYLLPNAVDYELFRNELAKSEVPEDLTTIPRPIIGYVGAFLDEKIDLELLIYLAKKRSGWSIVLMCDPQYEGDKAEVAQKIRTLKTMGNVFFIGRRPYQQIPAYIRHFDVCVAVYKEIIENEAANSLKLLTYLAAGRPVVSTNTGSAAQWRDVVRIASSREGFLASVERALAEGCDEERVRARLQTARAHSWQRAVDEAFEMMMRYLE